MTGRKGGHRLSVMERVTPEWVRTELIGLSEAAERNVNAAIMAFVDSSPALAEEVIADDEQADAEEIAIDEACVHLLRTAKHTEDEFRFLLSAIRIAGELELVSDLAVDISRQALLIGRRKGPLVDPQLLSKMLDGAAGMLRDSTASLIERDGKLAHEVCARDVSMKEFYKGAISQLEEHTITAKKDAPAALHMALAVRDIERIGDVAADIAEEVIFMLEGKIAREHQRGG